LAEVRKALTHLELAKQRAMMAVEGTIGRLAIGFVGSASFVVLPSVVRAFRADYPDVELALQESSGRRVLDLVASGELDLGLVRMPAVYNASVTIEPLERGHFVAVVPSEQRWLAEPGCDEI